MFSQSFRFFIIPYLIFFVIGFIVVFATTHGDAVLWLNAQHSTFLNALFKAWTYGGDGIFFGIVALALLIYKKRTGLIFLLVGAVQGLISWFLKKVVFSEVPRPKKYFEGQDVLDLIPGVSVYDFHSFPSGHTLTGFGIAAFLALVIGKKAWSFGLLLFAVMVGISRIYLTQHFLIDVVVGSFIGTFSSWFIHWKFEKYMKIG